MKVKYYIFEGGTLKIADHIPLMQVVQPNLALTELTKVQFYKLRLQVKGNETAIGIKSAYAATKRKAIQVKEAIKK